MTITTSAFSISPSAYIRVAAAKWTARWWWTVVLPLAACIVAGLHDLRFMIVALALVCIVYPFVLGLIYLSYALRPEAAFATIPHKITITDDEIVTEYEKDETRKTPPAESVAVESVNHVEITGGKFVISHGKSGYRFIIIPLTCVDKRDSQLLTKRFEDFLSYSDNIS